MSLVMTNYCVSRQEVTKIFDDFISTVINAFEQQHNYATITITMGTILHVCVLIQTRDFRWRSLSVDLERAIGSGHN